MPNNKDIAMERSMKLFGTDGVRGVVGEDLSAEMALRLGQITTKFLEGDGPPRVLIGRDTRVSGPMLEAALASGFMSMGAEVHLLGIAPTPAIAYLVKKFNFPLGAVISASHNPIQDNGIKFFGPDGFKLPDHIEDDISRRFFSGIHQAPSTGVNVGRIVEASELMEDYSRHLLSAASGGLNGLKIVLDCGNGAASFIAPEIFSELGADVIPVNAEGRGDLINVNCGSTAPEKMARAVVDSSADIGIAFDGDADRVIFADETGGIVDGDAVLASWGQYMSETGRLNGAAVVGTVLSNQGLEEYLGSKGIRLVRADVGDKYVLREMVSGGYALGGEQSGHIIFLEYNTTGDGILTSLLMSRLLRIRNAPLSKLAGVYDRFPQVQLNLKCRDKYAWQSDLKVRHLLQDLEDKLKEVDSGRILIRPSGTEPKVRVMVESRSMDVAKSYAEKAIEILSSFSAENEARGGSK